MPVLKPISGHSSARPIMLYLMKKNRSIAADYINLDAPLDERDAVCFDWAAEMDATRHALGNDVPWRGMRVRTYKHYIVSPDPKDHIGLDDLRDLTRSWASEHFGDYEVAIVYHDDNERGIPHAHVVVNNTNLETGRRLQDPDPAALNHSLQRMAAERGLRHFSDTAELAGVTARAEKMSKRTRPRSLQREYVRRAEADLVAQGEYSWTADIRARVRVARTVARSEAEFRGALSAMGIVVSDNSPKAPRRDWLYSFADHPARRISGEKLGLSYGRERLLSSFKLKGAGHLPDASEREIARIAKAAIEVGDLEGLRRLARAVALIDANNICCLRDLERFRASDYAKRVWTDPGEEEAGQLVAFIEQAGILPERASPYAAREPASRRQSGGRRGEGGFSSRAGSERLRDAPAQSQQQRTGNEKGGAR
ncbi:MAG: relaxase/mobilization nuclease domain-containing protein [Eggerthellaceae bacterium]|nr:relaxase/mobilization nuclease domain-containing protein [Eggerthellaceae bacterium]